MADPITIDTNDFDLTPKALIEAGFSPIIAGDDWEAEYTVLDEDGLPVSLSGATVYMTVAVPGGTNITRESAVEITGSSPTRYQIDIDVDQVGDGKGKFAFRFGREDADRDALLAAVGSLHKFDLRIVFGDSSRQTQSRGVIGFLAPITSL